MTAREIIKKYMYQKINGSKFSLEEYVREIFKGQNKLQLKQYCDEQVIYYKSGSSREMLIQKIYGSCNTILSYIILMTSDIKGESQGDYYKRIYAREFDS